MKTMRIHLIARCRFECLTQFTTPTHIWRTEACRTSTPEEQGMEPQKLEEMLAVIQERDMNIHGFLIIRNSYIVSERILRVQARPKTRYAVCRQEFHFHAHRYSDR